jgi:hypothetical protein
VMCSKQITPSPVGTRKLQFEIHMSRICCGAIRCCLLLHLAELLPPALALLREDADVLRGFSRVLLRRLVSRGRVLHQPRSACRGLAPAK